MNKIMFQPMYPNHLADKAFLQRLLGDKPRLITLEDGTCTHRAAKVIQGLARELHEINIDLVEISSFSQGVSLLRESSINYFMITPCIHEVSLELGSNSDFWSTKALDFVLTNPPIYLATKKGGRTLKDLRPHDRTVVTIKPLASCLAPEQNWNVVEVNSTQEAARKVATGETEFCITNADGAKANDLEILDEGIPMHMLWRFFKKIP